MKDLVLGEMLVKCLLIFVGVCSIQQKLVSQVAAYVEFDSGSETFQEYETVDGSILTGQTFVSVHIVAYLRIDTSGNVIEVSTYPLVGIGNDIALIIMGFR